MSSNQNGLGRGHEGDLGLGRTLRSLADSRLHSSSTGSARNLVGHHLLAHLEALGRDYERFSTVAITRTQCPLGSGAIAGSTLPLDRGFAAKALGFVDETGEPRLTPNGMDAVADRDVFVEFASAAPDAASIFPGLPRILSLEFFEFGFVELPDSFTTGSSPCPRKRTPILRADPGQDGSAHRQPANLLVTIKGLP